MLQEVLQADLFAFFLVFARVGSAVMLLPGFGERFVSPRLRLMIALGISLVVVPLVAPGLPGLPGDPLTMFLMLGGEIVIGLFLGTVARFLFSALQTAGMIVAYQAGMANALINDPTAAIQGALFSAFLGIVGIVVIFETGLHQLILGAVVDSYNVFTPGNLPPLGDFSEAAARVMADSFNLAMRIAAPIVVVALIFYLGLGLLGRLMPQMQVFFVALPLQITLGLLVLALSVSAVFYFFLGAYGNLLESAFGAG